MATQLSPQMAQQRKEGLMNRIRVGATAAGCALAILLGASVVEAQEVTGKVVGHVADKDTGAALGGVTVIVQGPQGEDAAITDEQGDYAFSGLKIGRYVVRFYLANTATQVEQPDVEVQAAKTVRVNAHIAGSAQAANAETTVIKARAPIVDVGSARVGATFDDEFNHNVPVPLTFGELIEKAPGAFIDPSGSVSIGGATGLENIYLVNGLNVTGTEFGNLDMGGGTLSGGTNLPLEFLTQVDVNSGGYQAEFGGAMGGVINTVLKSGTNEWHASVFGYDAPYWLSGKPAVIKPVNGAPGAPVANVLGSSGHLLDFDSQVGFEVGGPLVKNKLFLWAGFAPRITDTHVFRELYPLTDPNTVGPEATNDRRRLNETHRSYNYAATLDWNAAPEHHLNLALWGTPSFNTQLRSFNSDQINSDPSWALEQQNKVNTDVMAHWTSRFFDRHWLLEVNAGLHSESYSDKSPNDALNKNLNQLEYWGANLYDLEGVAACAPVTTTAADGTQSTFQPCPANNYHRGGFGQVKDFTAERSQVEIKSTNIFYAAGHAELKYGWRLEYTHFDQDRYYSGPLGSRGLVQLAPTGGQPFGAPDPYFTHQIFFSIPVGQDPSQFGPTGRPFSDLLQDPYYQDHLRAVVSSLSNALFAQGTWTPEALKNLTVNAGLRYEMQRMYDYHGASFLDAGNLGPRVSVIFDPFNDGRSKLSASYGKYYESIPMNMAARYFGGEGILVRNNVPYSNCPGNTTSPYNWTGAGEWRACGTPPTGVLDNPQIVSNTFNNGSTYPVQSHLQGQSHEEIVATFERQLMDDLSVRLDYQHRWLDNIIEDGTADPSGSFVFVLANPGNVPAAALTDAQNDVNKLTTAATANPNDAIVAANLGAAQSKLANLQGLAKAPKPQRTYDALTLTVNKRFGQNWRARASYTYSRLVGNYDGLYEAEGDYFAPNGNNAYDTPDLYLNQHGRLPNDHPHQGRVDGYYTVPFASSSLTFGLGFVARSGMPRNYLSQWYFGQLPNNMLLPRGSGGRTPTETQFDLHVAYALRASRTTKLEAFLDVFNLFDQKTVLQTDDVYTNDVAPSIVNGSTNDLKFAKNLFGQPLTRNPNYGNAVAYQAPISTRLGLRLSF
jgi:hypothetical protein